MKSVEQRIPSVDFYRAFAIVIVFLFHYDKMLPWGFMGVDLFFVISGYLVSKPYMLALKEGRRAEWWNFTVKRATKIFPSYYFFLIAGYFLAKELFIPEFPDQVYSLEEAPPYFFFYLNFVYSHPWIFKLCWSLCIEEHFYLFITLLMVVITFVLPITIRAKVFLIAIYIIIVMASVFRIQAYMHGNPNLVHTYVRMDALMLGVLLSYQEIYQGIILRNSTFLFSAGFLICVVCITGYLVDFGDDFYYLGIFTLVPLGFYLMIRGSRFWNFGNFRLIRWVAKYSYNVYLWHPFVSFCVIYLWEFPLLPGLALYVIITAAVAIAATEVIEKPGLRLRRIFLKSAD